MNGEQKNTTSGNPSVAIIILNYNGASVLPGLLESLSKSDYPNYRIFFVDNASTDGSAGLARDWADRLPIDFIQNEKNLFFSEGNNVGIKKAMEWCADFVFLLNNDTIIPSTLITELVAFMKNHPSAGVAGPMIYFGTPANTIWGAGGTVSLWWGLVRHRGIREKDTRQYKEPSIVDYVSGAAMMISRDVVEKIGMLDTGFPMYYEDTDFCYKARTAGFDVWYVPTAPLVHLVSVAAGGQASKFKIKRRFVAGMKFFARYARWYQWPSIILGQIYEAIRVGIMIMKGL
jgi:GT2 family glycosyltransferase